LKQALAGDKTALIKYHTYGNTPTEHTYKTVDAILQNRPHDYRRVPEVVRQVYVDQVKEKFGTLRFYYHGGDDYIRGLVDMADAMSAVTCETCGKPGKLHTDGWHYVSCDDHKTD
jgi:hypothetical protein